ncbi:hypothetical protein LTR08_000849 [Meristemomyces frigidus]|nr:hypothetical protein LTR08_000849 [Meristemomyces frigidus]
MPKRKPVQELSAASSDLSPPPEDLLETEQAVAGANGRDEDERPSKTRRGKPVQTEVVKEESEPATTPLASKRTRKQKAQVTVKEELEEEAADEERTPKKKRTRKQEVKPETPESDQDDIPTKPKPKSRQKPKPKPEEDAKLDADGNAIEPKPKRKSKAEKQAELITMPLAPRTLHAPLYIGAHVSAAGGLPNAIPNSMTIGANAFALFLKSQRKWNNPPLLPAHCTTFREQCATHGYDQSKYVVPHGSYLVNLAHTDPVRTAQAYESFVDDLKRCESLGVGLYNFHPGNDQTGGDRAGAIRHLAGNINRAHKATSTVVTLLENMAAGGNVLGSTFEDLRDVIEGVEDKSRVGVCLDTCHAFAGGYDLRSPEAYEETMARFDALVGMRYLRAVHLNDSKAPLASHRDLHANIGTGFLGLRAFHNVVNDPRMVGLPLILETPIEVRDAEGVLVKDAKGKVQEDRGIWAAEIKLLEGLVGADVGSEAFGEMERGLERKGRAERERVGEQVERKREKESNKAGKRVKKAGQGRGRKEEVDETDEEEGASDS